MLYILKYFDINIISAAKEIRVEMTTAKSVLGTESPVPVSDGKVQLNKGNVYF